MHTRRPASLLLTLVFLPLAACLARPDGAADSELTSVEGSEYTLEFDSFVYVPYGASDDVVRGAIWQQVKSSLGALRELGIGTEDRDARRNLDTADWTRTTLTVVEPDGTTAETIERVTYRYSDTALVDDDESHDGPLSLTLLFGDYTRHRDELVGDCTDDPEAAADSLWYHFHPGRWSCRFEIQRERRAIDEATAELSDPSEQIARVDRERRFVTTRATLEPVDDPPTLYPEYDRLWGFRGNTDRTELIVYAFFGVDKDESDPADWGLREYLRFQRTLRDRFPQLQVTRTEPFGLLLDFWVGGEKLEGITFDDVERWILDREGFPGAASDETARQKLLAQVVDRFSERWIDWSLPVQVSDGDTTRQMTVEIRTFYGYEDGSLAIRQRAQWRYLEAFWHGDVFAYTGHSHFGHGPLAPWYYGEDNFPERYQVMLVNSCLSFNYYDQDFIDVHPGGSESLDIVVNGLAAYWRGMGEATAGFVISLIDGEDKSWRELLTSMRVDLPWHRGYDPLRAVNGELDNRYSGEETPLEVTPR